MTITTEQRASQHDASTSTPAELEASNSVEDEFLGLVSHELRTPVTTILGNARLLQDRRDQLAVDQRDSMLADIAAEAERLHEIIENLLSLTRLGTGTRPELEPTALDRVIQRSVEQVRRRYPDHSIAFSSRPSVIVEAERTHLELLVENLVGNAAKYSPEGSPIDVRVEEAEDEVRVLVLDRGIGLDEQPTAEPVRAVLPRRDGPFDGRRRGYRAGRLPQDRAPARWAHLGTIARRRRSGVRLRAADRAGRRRHAPAAPLIVEGDESAALQRYPSR